MIKMRDVLLLFVHVISTLVKLAKPGGLRAVMAETLLIKQQLIVMNRNQRRAPKLTSYDRFLFGLFSLLINPGRFSKVTVVIKTSTLLRFHTALVKKKYQLLFSPRKYTKPGPKGPSQEVIDAIVEIKKRNPRYGSPRIAQLITAAFGIDINKDVVRRVLATHYKPSGGGGQGPSWLSLLGQTKDSLWSADMFRCESVLLRTHWILVVMDQYTRRIVGFAVYAGDIDGPNLCRMFNQIMSGQNSPIRLSTDNDPLFLYKQWQANLRICEIEEIKSVPFTPQSHPFVERLIGTIRREFLDHTLFWNQRDLQQKLNAFKDYYNSCRVHAGINGKTPAEMNGESKFGDLDIHSYGWKLHCNGLFQTPIAV